MNERRRRVLTESGVNVPATLARFAGNEALYFRFLLRFPQEPEAGALENAVRLNKREEMKQLTHTLKGASGNLGLEALYHACSEMMARLREDDGADVTELYARVRTELEKTNAMICALQDEAE